MSASRRSVLVSLAALGLSLSAGAGEVVRVQPWEFHSSFWVSLHQTLIDEAMRTEPRAHPDLTAGERTAWDEAVAAYRTAGGRGDMTFARPMVITTDALSQIADDATELAADAPLKDALAKAAAVYRRRGWSADDASSRFFIAYATAMLRDSGEALVRAHEKVYRTPWPGRITIYITPAAGPYGAYTITGKSGGVITTMSNRDEGYQGLHVLEMVLHESAHAVVGPNNGTVGSAINDAAKRRGGSPPRELWHAILFATSGELARRQLAERGVDRYTPISDELFGRAWPQYRDAIRKYWFAYLNGEGTLEQAIERVVDTIPR